MKKNILLIITLCSFLNIVSASELDEIDDFKSLLDDVSAIATKKSLNVDYLPSVVTVIDAQTYIDGGIVNIGEALGMLPGIQVQLSPMGYTMTTVRGLKNPNAYLSDKIKIFIDGVAINNEVSGTSSFYMDFPMQLVDKIEVLRGPGSTVYGAGAFYATVNVITKLGNLKKENQIFLGSGSYKYMTSGANVYTDVGDWSLFTDGYYQQNDKSLDVKNNIQATDEKMQDVSIGFKAVNGGFEFLTRFKQNVSGNFYSFEGELDPIPSSPKEHKNRYFFAQASYKTDLKEYELETKVNYSHRELDVGANIYSVADIAGKFLAVDIDMQEGFVYNEKSQEDNYEVETTITLPKIDSHDIFMGIGARYAVVTQDEFYSSVENTIGENKSAILAHANYDSFRYRENKESAYWTNPTTKLLQDDLSRSITYGFIQDLISLDEDIDIILGLRLDNYSDFGAQLSKRAGIVYRADDKLVLKLLYGSAFRAPTLIEAYANGHINFRAGSQDIEPEETNTYEAAVVYSPNLNNKFSLNVFYSQLSNVIDLEEIQYTNPGYQNYDDRVSKGIEFEYSYRTKLAHNLYFNASYIETQYTIPPEPGELNIDQSMPDISKLMLKAMYIYRPTTKLSFGTTWHYYSQTTQTKLQWVSSDATAAAVHIFDETLSYKISKNSELRATVKNLFNTEVFQPSYYYTVDGGIQREGRNWLLSYIYKL